MSLHVISPLRAYYSRSLVEKVLYNCTSRHYEEAVVCLRPKKTQWSHSELTKWAQITSNYAENNILCLRIADKHSLMEESEPMELMQKLTKWTPASQAKAWACSKVLLYGKFQWWCNTQASCITHAIHWACPVEFPDSGYKSSQQRRSASHSQPDLALYTSFLPLWNSIALLSLFGSQSLIPSYRTLSQ